MTLRVDKRAGSEGLGAPLSRAGLTVEMSTLPAGDVEIVGKGPGGRPLLVGVEYKLARDVLACVRDGRFAEQARLMQGRYEVRWLLIEGEWKTRDGLLEVLERRDKWRERGRYTMQEVVAWVLTMAQRAGMLVWRTRDRAESVEWLRGLYWWWVSKDFEEHRAHLAWYTPPWTPEHPFADEPSMVQKVAAALLSRGPTVDVNGERAKAAAARFSSVREMVDANEKKWREVEGVGAKIARQIVAEMA